METPNPGNLSMLPLDILRSLFERLSFVDFHRVKMVCTNWFSVSKQTVPRKSGSPWLILFTDNCGCVLYNPDEDKVYRSLRDFSGSRFLANSGKWFLLLDSRSNLYILDVFSERRIHLPPLENILSTTYTIERVGDKEFKRNRTDYPSFSTLRAEVLKGLLWVDEKTEEYVVVYFFDSCASNLGFCRKGDDYYTDISLCLGIPKQLQGVSDVVIRGYRLYMLTIRRFIRVVDFSGEKGFVDVTECIPMKMSSLPYPYGSLFSIAVTTAGEVLLVESIIIESQRSFHVYKKNPNLAPDAYGYGEDLVEVHSLGDEALLLDLGITVPANHTLGIKPNSIYFTHHDHARIRRIPYYLDICVFNLASKTVTHFSDLANMNLKDARWFLPL